MENKITLATIDDVLNIIPLVGLREKIEEEGLTDDNKTLILNYITLTGQYADDKSIYDQCETILEGAGELKVVTLHYTSSRETAPEDKEYKDGVEDGYKLTKTDLPKMTSDVKFLGWYIGDDKATVGMVVGEGDASVTVELVAKWDIPQVTITYNSEHGDVPQPKSVDKGYELTNEDLPELSAEGYVFKSWDKEAGYVVNEDTTITASWEETPVEEAPEEPQSPEEA